MYARPGPTRTLTVVLALALALASIVGTTTTSFAAGKGNKAVYETFVVANLDALADCVGLEDARACVQNVPGAQVSGFGFVIAAFLKFKAHKGNPGIDVDALRSCLIDGVSADACLDDQDARIGGPSMPALASGIQAHSVFRDLCPLDDVDCSETPDEWPDGWDWDYE